MLVLGMQTCIHEENPQRQLSRRLNEFLILGVWQFINQYNASPDFLI